MIRRILVPLDPSDNTAAATNRGLEIASSLQAILTGLTVVDTEGIKDAAALPFHLEMLDYPPPAAIKMVEDATAKLDAACDAFLQACRQRNVGSELRRLGGTPADGIVDLARFHDLVVMGLEANFQFVTEENSGDTREQVLELSSAPVLLVPPFETDPIRRALITYDGSPPATRALHAFAEVYPVYEPEVRIVVAHKNKQIGGHLLDEAQKYLQVHQVEKITTELFAGDSIREAVEDGQLEWAELVVAGIHSKLSFKKVFVGSFTNFLIETGHRSILVSL